MRTVTKTMLAEASVEKGQFRAKITTAAVDREGDVVVPQGMNAVDYMKNPVVFWNHDYGMPVAKCVDLRRRDDHIEAVATFAARPDGHQGEFFPDMARALVEQGIVKGVSIGFVGMEGGVRAATKADAEKYGDDCRRVFSKWKLLEFSLAPLPANQDALISAVGKGLVSPGVAKRYFGVDAERTSQPTPPAKSSRRVVVVVPSMPKRHVERPITADTAARLAAARHLGRPFFVD